MDDEGKMKVVDIVAVRSERGAWFARLQAGEKGLLPTLANAMAIFANDPELAGLVAYNEFSSRGVLLRSPPPTEGIAPPGPFPRAWEKSDEAFCLAYFQRVFCSGFRMETIVAAMSAASIMRRFHPVREYLGSLHWDGVRRLETWLAEVFGAAADDYHAAVGTKFMCAAVRRVRKPGPDCKFDNILILEGPQDLGKSLVCRRLFDPWFTDTLPSDLNGRHMSHCLQGVWGVEFAEIQHFLRSEPEAIKAFLSKPVERYIAPYGRMEIERPRQCVFIGTTNSDDYGRDSTGNRRLWPVRCLKADADWVSRNRDQLWAEASLLEDGMPLWLDQEPIRQSAVERQASRSDEDPWEESVLMFIRTRESVSVPEILSECIQLARERQDKRAQMRLANILRRCGWRRVLDYHKGIVGRRWLAPTTHA